MANRTSTATSLGTVREALRRSDERFRLLVDTVKDYAIFMLDPDGYVMTWNAGAERLKGYRADEIIGRHFSLFYPDDVKTEKPVRELEEAERTGRAEDEGWRVRKDGTQFWANVVITALRDEDGVLVGFAKVTRDLTERRHAEEDRIRRAQAEEGVRLRDEFLSSTSHELRTPLSTLRLQIDTLIRMVERNGENPVSGERVLGKLATVQSQVDRLQRLMDDLLDQARISSGQLPMHLEAVDLVEVGRAAIERFGEVIATSGCKVSLESDGPMIGNWDLMRIEQVVANLLGNALKYGRGGAIEIAVRGDDQRVVLTVQDHGIGIAPDEQTRVFGRFERAVDDRHFAGLGLGLWIARSIVEQHGGTIGVVSAPGNGAKFIVELPRGTA